MTNITVFKATEGKRGTEKLKGGFYFARAEDEKKNRVFVFYVSTDKEQFTAYIPPELVMSEIAEALCVKFEEQ